MSTAMTEDWRRDPKPYWPGNTESLRHGADSERRVRPLADRLAAEVTDAAPWLSRPTFAAAVAAWARAEARARLVTDWLEEHGQLDAKGVPRPAATYALRLEASAAARRAALGLDPASFAKLLVAYEQTTTAVDVREALIAAGMATMAGRSSLALPAAQEPAEGPETAS